MSDKLLRPNFPSRAVITGGMPYGEKPIYFHHVGGYFVHADIFARFMRNRIGAENVLFVSGTDCYGSSVELGYETAVADGFDGSISDFVSRNHKAQREILEQYQISLNLYAGSALGEPGEIHTDLSAKIFNRLYETGNLKLEQTVQFFDAEKGTFLNGRQVKGRCPIQGCKAENAYADECSLGHQYTPDQLIEPISVLSGKTPERVTVDNWFFDLPAYNERLSAAIEQWEFDPACRKPLIMVINEFLKKPSIYVKNELIDEIKNFSDMPSFTIISDEKKPSSELVFNDLATREKAVSILADNLIRYRTGKTLVPFRLSGNVKWGIPVPERDDISGLTFWVWPESLWAPISFCKAVLGDGTDGTRWENWWKSDDAKVYQFIGEDNIYFYGIAEMGLFMALDEGYKLPLIVPNKHILFGKKKASSSGEVKPPTAAELLEHYTAEQLRLHFMNVSLSERNVGFEPKAILGKSGNNDFDTVLYEGNLVTIVFNRLVRSCFYTVQKYNDGVLPTNEVSADVKSKSDETILEYERFMSEIAFDKVFELLNVYLRDANKDWSVRSKSENPDDITALLADSFHIVRTAAALLHPVTPVGCEMIREYLDVDERLWDWEYIFEPLTFFTKPTHKFKFLEPRIDFFTKHPSHFLQT